MRRTRIARDVRAACRVCHGDNAHWFGGNSQGVAARHHDATGHEVWVEVYMNVTYGGEPSSNSHVTLPDQDVNRGDG